MKQPIKNKKISHALNSYKKRTRTSKKPEISDGSKLETYFRVNILEALNIEYVQQYKLSAIGRYYDFYLPEYNILIECDGDYWHADPKKYKKEDLNAIQKRNIRVDEQKNKYALMYGYVLLRFWEKDVYKNKKKVISILEKRIGISKKENKIKQSKKDGSFFKKKRL